MSRAAPPSSSSSSRAYHDIPFERLKSAARVASSLQNESDSDEDLESKSVSGSDHSSNTSDSDDGSSSEHEQSTSRKVSSTDAQSAKLQKTNRKRPLEVSSKRPVYSSAHPQPLRKKILARDPRFSDLSGTFNADLFSKSFGFIEELEQNEKQETINKLRDYHLPEPRKQRLKTKLDKIRSVEHHRRQLKAEQDLRRELNKQEKQKIIETGKKPFVHSACQIQRMLKERKFEGLKERGKLNKHLVKARKKQASKDRKFMPTTRRGANDDGDG